MGEKLEHPVRDLEILELAGILLDLLLENAEPQLVIGRVQVGDQAPTAGGSRSGPRYR